MIGVTCMPSTKLKKYPKKIKAKIENDENI